MSNEKSGTTTTPVYVPYATLISALDSLKRDGIPGTGKIDKTLWDSQSGAIQGQLLLAFRFLGLIDERNRVLPALPPFVEASPEDRKPLLRTLIEEKYSTLLSLDLNTITQGQLDEALRSFGIGGSTIIRAGRFFVKACQEVGIPISNRVTGKSRPNSSATPRKRKNGHSSRHQDDQAVTGSDSHTKSSASASSWEEKLLDKFPQFDPDWPDDLKAKWFEGFGRLMNAKTDE